MLSWTISSRRIRDNQEQKGLDIISTLTASIANRMSHNWSSCAMFPQSSATAVDKYQRQAVILGSDTPQGGTEGVWELHWWVSPPAFISIYNFRPYNNHQQGGGELKSEAPHTWKNLKKQKEKNPGCSPIGLVTAEKTGNWDRKHKLHVNQVTRSETTAEGERRGTGGRNQGKGLHVQSATCCSST